MWKGKDYLLHGVGEGYIVNEYTVGAEDCTVEVFLWDLCVSYHGV